jgi:hypothetical protein
VSFTVTVTGSVPGFVPAGTANLLQNGASIATAALAAGGGSSSATLPAAFGVGSYAMAGQYTGDAYYLAANSAPIVQVANNTGSADSDGDGIPDAVELAQGTNPNVRDNDVLGSHRLFVMQQYRDFLQREGDAGGIDAWTALLAAGAVTRPAVVEGFLGSPEFDLVMGPVTRLYFSFFQRVPDNVGLAYNAGLVRKGQVTLQQLADAMAASGEFQSTYGSLDDAQYVALLYQNVLGREPDADGLAGWVALLGGGMTRGQVMLGFSESPEYKAAMQSEVLVTMLYAVMLGRQPDPGGFSGWVGALDAGSMTRLQAIDGFIHAPEYQARFLP